MDQYFQYLERLRESGIVNMFGAIPYLQREFPELGFDDAKAKAVLCAWMDSAKGNGTTQRPINERTSMAVPASDRTFIVTEICPHCESEIQMRWNTDERGFKAFCPVCGKRLMLCDECRHTPDEKCPDGGICDYNGQTDSCRHNPEGAVSNG